MPNAAVLIEAKRLILDERDWIKESFAEDADGRAVIPDSPHACKFCLQGAVAHVMNVRPGRYEDQDTWGPTEDFLNKASGEFSGQSDSVDFNDGEDTRHGDVLRFFDFIIAKALEQEKPR